ncbi:MAG: hypothetical protein DDT40_01736 [candidate division WS2 bacterium]|nr:hypothetical protein [Candidatus Psychracetigena formicireducens]
MYGRRRVGKTTLINEFVKDKEAIFFTGIEGNGKENLEGLSKSIYSISQDFADASSIFSSFREALETAFKIAEKRRIIFVIDEYPYIAGSYKALTSILQILIDEKKDISNMFLILCGSSLSFMESQVLGYTSPLFGRRTCQYKILPFDFFEARNYYNKFSNEDLAVIYGVTGGIPLYMSLVSDNLSVEENIKANFLTPNAYLFEEPTNLIKQECREPAQYNSIIKAIATGSSRMSEICSKTGLDTGLAASYLYKLMSIGIVKKEMPFGTDRSRKTIYVLDDSMFRFWYRFIPDNMAAINRGFTDAVFKKIAPQISSFMGGVFEEICKQYLWELNRQGKAAAAFTDLGRWWGNDPKNKCEAEVDIVAKADDKTAIFCECKWTNDSVDASVLNTLVERSKLFSFTNVFLYLFSKTGFTDGCTAKADELGKVKLLTLNEMRI